MDKHPHIPPGNTRPHSRLEDRDPFVWRKPDEGLLERTPMGHMMDAPPHLHPGGGHHSRPPTPPGHMYHTPDVVGHAHPPGLRPRPRSRSLPRSPTGPGPGGHRSRSRYKSTFYLPRNSSHLIDFIVTKLRNDSP